jgi:acetylornithine aminotransferase
MLEETLVATDNTTLEREHQALFPTYDRFAIGTVSHADGLYIHTDQGSYLDLIAGLGVNALGHSNPKIIAAIEEQAAKYLHLSNLYLQEPQVKLAEQVKKMSGWERVFFCNSGTEAVEGAIKLARKHFSSEAKAEVLGLPNSFHGRTYGPLSVMDKEKYRAGYGPFLGEAGTIAELTTHSLRESVSNNTAAVILEVIQGEGGIVEIPAEFIAELQSLREKHGFLIIADEIQSGIGRTGTFFAYEQFGLDPDIVVCAKAIGGGLPLGAILTSAEIAEAMRAGVHGTTFGGNALACAAGSVVLDELENGLLDEVAQKGAWFKSELEKLAKKYPNKIEGIRGKGFMLGLNFQGEAKPVHQQLLEWKILTNVTHQTVLRLLPPLVAPKAELERFLERLEEAVEGST